MTKISKQVLVPVLLFFLIVGIAVVAGGWERWEVANDLQGNQEGSEIVTRFKTKIENEEKIRGHSKLIKNRKTNPFDEIN